MTFPVENIDNNSKLYYRVHKSFIINGELIPGVFKEREDGEKSMSTDWEKYSTPLESRKRARKPEENGIGHFISGNLRNLNLSVKHTPLDDNRSHTSVKGINKPIEKDEKIRLKPLDEIEWDIYPNEPIIPE